LAGFGYSAGAQLVCLLGFDSGLAGKQPAADDQTCPPLRAVVAGGTPCDLTAGTHGGLLRCVYLGGTRRQYPERYRQASPLNHLSACCPPTFFYHGDVDRMVGAEGVRTASRRLRELGVRSEVYWVKGKGHVATFADDAAIRQAAAFLTDVLGPAAEPAPADNDEHD
jgi:acetyl esterase/lipase